VTREQLHGTVAWVRRGIGLDLQEQRQRLDDLHVAAGHAFVQRPLGIAHRRGVGDGAVDGEGSSVANDLARIFVESLDRARV
jgi:hypothetical protein